MFCSSIDNDEFNVAASTRGNALGSDLVPFVGGPNLEVPAATPNTLAEATGVLSTNINANTSRPPIADQKGICCGEWYFYRYLAHLWNCASV